MYALIYDEHKPDVLEKNVISIHKTREEAEGALNHRRANLGRKIRECRTRIVWVKKDDIREGSFLTPIDFETWGPGDKIPEGEWVSDTD